MVARAVAGSGSPWFTAVGHETDVTLGRFRRDLRAPTPSAAAELVVRDVSEVKQELSVYRLRLRQGMISRIGDLALRVESVPKGAQPGAIPPEPYAPEPAG